MADGGSAGRGAATADRIVDAAWTLVDGTGLEGLLGGVSLRQVAAAAGRTTGSVAHHFGTTTGLADAMVDWLVDQAATPVDPTFVEVLDAATPHDLGALSRRAATAAWDAITGEVASTFNRRLLRCWLVASADTDDSAAVRAALVERHWRQVIQTMLDHYGRLFAAAEVRLRDGLDPDELVRLVEALIGGLFLQWIAEPDAVRPSLFADAAVALAVWVTEPADGREPPRRVPREPSPGALDALEVVTAWFDAHGERDGDLSDLAGDGVDAAELQRWFGSFATARAASLYRLPAAVASVWRRHLGTSPDRALVDAVVEVVRTAQRRPSAAAALLAARVRAGARRGGRPAAEAVDPAELVALDPVIAAALLAADLPDTAAGFLVDAALQGGVTQQASAPALVAAAVVASVGLR